MGQGRRPGAVSGSSFGPTPGAPRAGVSDSSGLRAPAPYQGAAVRAVRQQVGQAPTLAGLAQREAVGAIGQRPRIPAQQTAKGGERLAGGCDLFRPHLVV